MSGQYYLNVKMGKLQIKVLISERQAKKKFRLTSRDRVPHSVISTVRYSPIMYKNRFSVTPVKNKKPRRRVQRTSKTRERKSEKNV